MHAHTHAHPHMRGQAVAHKQENNKAFNWLPHLLGESARLLGESACLLGESARLFFFDFLCFSLETSCKERGVVHGHASKRAREALTLTCWSCFILTGLEESRRFASSSFFLIKNNGSSRTLMAMSAALPAASTGVNRAPGPEARAYRVWTWQ